MFATGAASDARPGMRPLVAMTTTTMRMTIATTMTMAVTMMTTTMTMTTIPTA